MSRDVSSDWEFGGERRKRRSKADEEAARWRAQTKGGNPEDYYEELDRASKEPRGSRAYTDDVLTGAGFKLIKTYDYTDRAGGLLYQSVRYEHPDVPNAKQFRQRRKGMNGLWLADAGLVKVPYRWHEMIARADDTVHYTEGEKDADRLSDLGLLATTLAGQQWSPEAAKAFKGRDIVILGDNDDAGRDHVKKAVEALTGFAANLRVVKLPGVARTEDVSDWLDKGHTKEDLLAIVAAARHSGMKLVATGLLDPKAVPAREWVYKPDYIRRFVSLLMSTGGVGKSSLVIAEALALVSGKPLLRVKPMVADGQKLRVWYWNGEDPLEELQRRFAAAQKHFKLDDDDMGEGHLFINSGRLDPIIIAEERQRVFRLNDATIERIVYTLRENKIDVVIVDPFVTTHRVPENDNGAIDAVVKAWNRIAEETNTAVMLVHHTRKPNGNEATVDDARGASALLAAARSARAVNGMTQKEAQLADLPESERRRYFSTSLGKTNLTRAPEDRTWFKLESVNLENGLPFGDEVGVVTSWTYPKFETPKLTDDKVRAVCARIETGGPWREDQRSKTEPWVGRPIAEALGLDLVIAAHKKEVARLVSFWLETGVLVRRLGLDRHREQRAYVEVAKQKGQRVGLEETTAADVTTAAPAGEPF